MTRAVDYQNHHVGRIAGRRDLDQAIDDAIDPTLRLVTQHLYHFVA